MPRRQRQQISDAATDPSLIEAAAQFKLDPLGFVMWAFPWGQPGTALADQAGPDVWQVKVLSLLAKLVRESDDPASLREAIRIAVASGHGIGKTALVAWIILWFISTRPHPQIVVTANTTSQLTGKTWRELAKWHKLLIVHEWFAWTATKFYFKESPEDWFAAAIPWSKERADAFAGTHDKHVLIIFDEASAIADEIWDVAEGAMTTKGAIWLCFGNPTKNTGRFRECFSRFRHRWSRMQVDSRLAKMANKAQLKAWIEDYGEDSDFVRIRVKGQFPRASSAQLIGQDVVDEALRRVPEGYEQHAKLLSVDVARFGSDQSVILKRQGPRVWQPIRFREMDTAQLAFRVVEVIKDWEPDAIFVDAVGVGAGVVDMLRLHGYEIIEVNAGLKAADERKFFNKRAEMWWLMREWLKTTGCLPGSMIGHNGGPPLDDEPVDQELIDDLLGPEYGYDAKERVQLETKDDMKARGLPSPDAGDALADTFFMPVAAPQHENAIMEKLRRQGRLGTDGTSWMAR